MTATSGQLPAPPAHHVTSAETPAAARSPVNGHRSVRLSAKAHESIALARQLIAAVTTECLISLPQPDDDPAGLWRLAAELATRGVRVVAIRQPDTGGTPASARQFTDKLTKSGISVRTTPAPLIPMIVCDQRVSLIWPDPSGGQAVLVNGPAFATFLAWLFDVPRLTGSQTGNSQAAPRATDFSAKDLKLMQLLLEGVPDDTAARHMGTAVRTFHRRYAALSARLGANNRVKFGYMIRDQGLTLADALAEPAAPPSARTARPNRRSGVRK